MMGDQYVYLNFNQFLLRVNVAESRGGSSTTKTSKGRPALETVVDFQESNLPIGMAPFVLDSKLYMVGGVTLRKDMDIVDAFSTSTFKEADINRTVFVFDPSDPKPESRFSPFSSDPPNFPKMNSLMIRPIVEPVDGKIYFIAYRWGFGVEYVGPSFVVFDPAEKSWEILPDPPFHEQHRPWSARCIICHFVLGHKIHVVTKEEEFCFDVHAKKWEAEDAIMDSDQKRCAEVFFPRRFSGNVVERDRTLIACVLVAYHFAPGWIPKSYRVMEELKSLFDPPLKFCLSFLVDMGNGKICFVATGCNNHRTLLRVSTFEFDFTARGKGRRLSHHVFNVDKFYLYKLSDAFVIQKQQGNSRASIECKRPELQRVDFVRQDRATKGGTQNLTHKASGRLIKSVVLNKEARQRKSSPELQSEQNIRISNLEKGRRQPRPINMQSDLNGHASNIIRSAFSSDGHTKRAPDNNLIGNDLHGVSQSHAAFVVPEDDDDAKVDPLPPVFPPLPVDPALSASSAPAPSAPVTLERILERLHQMDSRFATFSERVDAEFKHLHGTLAVIHRRIDADYEEEDDADAPASSAW